MSISLKQRTMFQNRVASWPISAQNTWKNLASAMHVEDIDTIVPSSSPDRGVSLLVEFGFHRDGSEAVLKKGLPSRCHANAAALMATIPGSHIETGYALSSDGLWRCHSWTVTTKGAVLESTVLREKYFGVALKEESGAVFGILAGVFDVLPSEEWFLIDEKISDIPSTLDLDVWWEAQDFNNLVREI